MPIYFNRVKAITIPEGSVTKITDSTGNILWQSVQSEGWHTIWEGSETCSLTKKGSNNPAASGVVQNLAQTVAATVYKPKIRITFSYSNTNTDYNKWKDKFIVNGSTKTTISSPLTIDAVGDISFFSSYTILAVMCASNDSNASNSVSLGVVLKKTRDTKNNNIIFSLDKMANGSDNDIRAHNGNFTVTLTVTKIEQYY